MKNSNYIGSLQHTTNTGFTRRDFLRKSAAATIAAAVFPTIVPGSALGKGGAVAPSNRICVGVIGCGPQGRGDMGNFLREKDCQVLAVCDVKTDQLGLAKDAVDKHYGNHDCETYHDFRQLVARKDIDACLIATPDHWHVLTALAAVNSGKDVYLEKPLAVTLEEGQALRKAVRKRKRVFQFGTQQRSDRMFWQACQLVRNGRIGKLQQINVWAPGSAPGGPLKQVPPPPGLDYDLWLGPAPTTPFTEDRCTDDGYRKTWWFITDYTLGFHFRLGHPSVGHRRCGAGATCSAARSKSRGGAPSATRKAPAIPPRFGRSISSSAAASRLKFVGVPNGQNQGKPTGDPWLHRDEWKARYRRIEDHGTAFEGSEGWVHVDRGGINLQPENLIDIKPESLNQKLVRSPGHVRNFLDCIKSRADTVCPVEAAVAADTLCHLADAATRLERKLTFDFRTEKFLHDECANQRLKARPMRKPWHL